METASQKNGKPLNVSHRDVSIDGKTLTITGTTSHVDGSKEEFHSVFERVAGSVGFVGSWREKDLFGKSRVMVTSLSNSAFRVEYPLLKLFTDMNLDGSDAVVQTQDRQTRATQTARRNSPLEFMVLTKADGKPTAERTFTLSVDGMTLIVEFWNPNHPSVTGRWIYERQK